jgi:TusA-related sulfurtransferase
MNNSALRTVDLRGLAAPLPIAKAASFVRELLPGDGIEILASDRHSLEDFRAWCAWSGNRLVEWSREGDTVRILIEKG